MKIPGLVNANAITEIIEEKMHKKAGNKIKSRKILRFFGVRRKQTLRCCSGAQIYKTDKLREAR